MHSEVKSNQLVLVKAKLTARNNAYRLKAIAVVNEVIYIKFLIVSKSKGVMHSKT